MAILRSFILLGMIIVVAVFAWAHHNARIDPIVRTARIGFRDWPTTARPVRVALLSDIHIGNESMDAARLARIVRQVNALEPDLIVLAGDYIAGHRAKVARKFAPQLTAPLAALRAPLGVVAVMGNHDYDTDPAVIRRALGAAGVRILDNAAVARGALTIAGIDDRLHGRDDLPKTLAAVHRMRGIPIAVSHDGVNRYQLRDITLELVGHTHCGQVELEAFGIRNPVTHTNYTCGISRMGRLITLTTAGVGTSLVPFRVNAPPDLWLLTIGPAVR
ncbi:metallophosphoesterase [Sphingomonas sp. PsM26]|nr:metallophosphoesterase [Sphingomonas sp. PsM26]